MTNKKTGQVREFVGTVTSVKTINTAIVTIERFVSHPIYGKRIRRSQRFAVETAGKSVAEGDTVRIRESRPISKTKHFLLVDVLKK